MALTKDNVLMTGKSTGIALEVYEDKYSLKSVRTYQGRDGNEVLTYDWIYPEVYDKDKKKRVIAEKPRPGSVYLGDRDQAIASLSSILAQLGGDSTVQSPPGPVEDGELPF